MLNLLTKRPLAPFSIRSFRYQWPSDMLVSYGFEMETLVLGWYILVETNSVILLTIFGSLRYIGTLVSPWFGLAGDRWGRKNMMLMMRAFAMILSTFIVLLSFLDMLTIFDVLIISGLSGLVQPSDVVMRNSLIGDSMPETLIMKATSIGRMARDSARVFGALTGAGLFSILGLGVTYVFIFIVYFCSLCLTFKVSRAHPRKDICSSKNADRIVKSQYQEFKEGLTYIWKTPPVLAIIWLGFLVNLVAMPVSHGLLPFVAKDILNLNENGLSHLIVAFSVGAIIGSIVLASTDSQQFSTRLMLVSIVFWFFFLVCFSFVTTKLEALSALTIIGLSHGIAMTSMASSLLSATDPLLRGRVIWIRVLAVYGVPIGLLLAGLLIENIGFFLFTAIYAVFGILATTFIGFKWRKHIWY